MSSIIPHILLKDEGVARLLEKDGYSLTKDGSVIIVHKELPAQIGISQESIDTLTEKLQNKFESLNRVEEKLSPAHVLVRNSVRANLTDKTPSRTLLPYKIPLGYIVELTNEGPIVLDISRMTSVPLLAGYGSLLDPAEIACNDLIGDARNTLTYDKKLEIAEQKNIKDKISYAKVSGIELLFNRAPTASRYGDTQEKRNAYSVLNIQSNPGKEAYLVVFDPSDITSTVINYLARENFDEMEYARRRIDPKDVQLMGTTGESNIDLSKGLWVLDSPQITDVAKDGRLQSLIPNSSAVLHESYITRITNGLVGAERAYKGFWREYVTNTFQNNEPLYKNQKFMEVLQQKIPDAKID